MATTTTWRGFWSGWIMTRGTDVQLAATDPEATVWVAASAGTGKTHLLTNRVLRLLLAGNRPDGILCLTFTRAAAAEMAGRIHDRLGRWAMAEERELADDIAELTGRPAGADDLKRARRLFAQVLDLPDGPRIQTIHAFCQSLLGRFPLESSVPPHFALLDDRNAAELREAAKNGLLARVREGAGEELAAALAWVTGHALETAFDELMAGLTGAHGRLTRMAEEHGGAGGIAEALRRRLALDPGETEAAVLRAACAEGTFDREGLKAALPDLLAGGAGDQKKGGRIAAWLEAEDREAIFGDYALAFLKGDGEPLKTLATKATIEALPDGGAALAAERDRLAAVRGRMKLARVAEATEALLTLGFAVIDAYGRAKRSGARLDYDDLILHARRLLEREGIAPWILYKLDGGLDHVLIDEAQDTSPDQWRVVSALTAEFFAGEGAREETRTVFSVGDLKQSIFGFQGADPEAFAAMRRHFEERAGQADRRFAGVPLDLSYRSTESVLRAVDAVFASPEASDGLVIDGTAMRHQAKRAGQAGLVEIWPTETPSDRKTPGPWLAPVRQARGVSASRRLARRMAEAIAGWVGHEELEARGRTVRPGDIMILVRQRDAFVHEMVDALKARRVPVAGTDRMMLGGQLPVMDLLALTRFALLPEDDFNLAVVLKGPLVEFDDDVLFELAHGRENKRLWRVLGERRGENQAFARAHALLNQVLGRADFTPPYEFYARLLDQDGGRKRIVARMGGQADDPLDEFLGLALHYEQDHAPSLQGFLHWMESSEAEVKRDMEQGRDEVRVLTVHAAKGLQAPIVMLPDTTRVSWRPSRLLPMPAGNAPDPWQAGLLAWPMAKANEVGPLAEAREEQQRQEQREYRRLLYVAMTRAEDRLYVCGWENQTGRKEGCWYDLVAAAFDDLDGVEEVPGPDGEAVRRISNPQTAPPRLATAAGPPPKLPKLPGWAKKSLEAESATARPLAPSRLGATEPPPRSPLLSIAGEDRYQRGLWVHRLLETLPGLPAGEWQAAAERYLNAAAPDLDGDARRGLIAEVVAVLSDPDFARLFGPASRAEVAVTGRIGERVVAGQIDRLVADDHEVLIVDYKTHRDPPAGAGQIPAAYLDQLAAYREIVAGVFPDRPVRCALLWTDGPILKPVAGELLDGRLDGPRGAP